MIKVDHNFSDKDKLTGRFMRVVGIGTKASVYPNGGGGDPTLPLWMANPYLLHILVIQLAGVPGFAR